MTDLFLDILNISFSATWVVLGVVLARLVLKKAPRSLVCALWALVALRLLFGGIEAPFSLIPSSEIIPPESLFDQAPAIHSGISSLDNAVNPIYSEALRPTPGASVNPLQVWLAVFANLWVLGMGAMALCAAISCGRVSRQVRESIPAEEGVYLCDRIVSPFIFGLFRPKIYLPSDLGEESRAHVIAHEKAHLARRDHWWKPLGFALLTINWFNPALWLAYVLLCRDIEMACDERVVRNFGTEEKKAYSAALLRCSVNTRRITACPLAFGEVGVKQRVKSVLNYKKPAFWIILTAVVLCFLLAAGLLTDPPGRASELYWNGHLYTKVTEINSYLPSTEPIGTLRSILHNTNDHPTEELQASNLDESLAGCPLYPDGSNLYLVKYDGSCILFELQTAAESLTDFLKDRTRTLDLTLHPDHLQISENLTDQAAETLAGLIRQAAKQPMTAAPSPDWVEYATDSDAWVMLMSDSTVEYLWLIRSARYGWVCISRNGESGDRAWLMDGSSMDSFISTYESELDRLSGCFPLPGNNQFLSMQFQTTESHGITFRAAIPYMDVGSPPVLWRWEPLENGIGFRTRPAGSGDWMEFRFHDTEDTLYYYYPGIQDEPITLPSGATGTLYHSGDPCLWSMIKLNTTQGQLLVTAPDTVYGTTDWSDDDYQMALAIVRSLTVVENGTSLLTQAPPSAAQLCGITLLVEDVTSAGLRLVYSHQDDSAEWVGIVTSPQWFLEKWENDIWVNIVPADTAWSEVMYGMPINGTTAETIDFERVLGSLDQGHYRIGKTFSAHPEPDDTKSTTHALELTCWAEFDVNPLGITLSVENVTPNGATLVCTQDGTLWNDIITGSPWNLERYEDGGWVSVMPESTVWTTIAYLVPQGQATSWNINWSLIVGSIGPGRYRVSKTFTGERRPMFTLGLENESIDQTCYAEFTIE